MARLHYTGIPCDCIHFSSSASSCTNVDEQHVTALPTWASTVHIGVVYLSLRGYVRYVNRINSDHHELRFCAVSSVTPVVHISWRVVSAICYDFASVFQTW